MAVVEVQDPGLGNTSYVVDLGDGSALVVDPERDPRPYLETAQRMGLVIRHVAETHLHADFVSGARELVALGAGLIAPGDSRLAHPHRPVTDGDEVDLGGLTLRALATPGHTPEHVTYLLVDGDTVVTAFTGGTLMVGGVARPDLISPDLTLPLARLAFHSVRRLLDTLPEQTVIRPTHGGGSLCAAGPSGSAASATVGDQRRTHPVTAAIDADEFADRLLAGLGSYPTYFGRLRPVNQRGPEVYGVDLPALAQIPPAESDHWAVVDVRPIDRFAAGHVPGSVSIELRAQFGTWLGWLFEPDTSIAFVVDPDQDERDLVRQALNVGHHPPFGRLSIDDWTAGGGGLGVIPLVDPSEAGPGVEVIDVRQRSEWEQGHVPGATHVELARLAAGFDALAGQALVHCGHGQRAMTAASLIRRRSEEQVLVTASGPAAIARAIGAR